MLLIVVIVCNLLVTIPCIWGAFLQWAILFPLSFGWLFYCGAATAVEYFVLAVLLGPPGRGDTLMLTYFVNLAQCAVVFGALLIFRALGFKLVRVSRKMPAG